MCYFFYIHPYVADSSPSVCVDNKFRLDLHDDFYHVNVGLQRLSIYSQMRILPKDVLLDVGTQCSFLS